MEIPDNSDTYHTRCCGWRYLGKLTLQQSLLVLYSGCW